MLLKETLEALIGSMVKAEENALRLHRKVFTDTVNSQRETHRRAQLAARNSSQGSTRREAIFYLILHYFINSFILFRLC